MAATWDDFAAYDAANPHVYRAFDRFAREAVSRGRRRIGSKLIFERMRWYLEFETTGDGPKLNNNWTPFYARKWMAENPGHDELFRTRACAAEVTP